MVHRYNMKAGWIFAAAIAMMATVLPRLIRLDTDQPHHVVVNFLYLSGTIFFYWMVHHFFLNRLHSGPFSYRLSKALISIGCSVVIISFFTYMFNITRMFPIGLNPGIEVRKEQIPFIRIFRATLISTFTWFAAFYYRLLLMLQQSKLENEYLKQKNLQAQISSLKQQISPHFLFNSLNTLSTLSHEAPVKEYVLKMSEVYRYVLHHQEQAEVQVREELEFIHSYIYILQSRFEEGLEINIRVNPDYLNRKILPFAVQLLIENAIKHNSMSYRSPLAIDIYDQQGKLVVENDLRPRTTMDKPSGTGLHNLSQRYQLAAGRDIQITRNDLKFKVEIPFLL
ncbi:MAG: histidine kinase [Bacteroidota bacterium]